MKAATPAGRRLLGAAAALFAFGIDQASKYWLLDVYDIALRQPVRLAPVFDVVLAWNLGVSYSLLTTTSDEGRWLLLAGALAITLVLWVWMWRAGNAATTIALGLVIGGALGNAADRWIHGAVADFFFFHVGSFRWYVFNLADCAIVAGVALLLLESFGASRANPSSDNKSPDC
jgi:signal peptidase II